MAEHTIAVAVTVADRASEHCLRFEDGAAQDETFGAKGGEFVLRDDARHARCSAANRQRGQCGAAAVVLWRGGCEHTRGDSRRSTSGNIGRKLYS